MLRPLLAFACLALTAFLLAPTVQSVHEQVEALDIKRDLPRLWKWDRPEAAPEQLLPPICDDRRIPLFSEVDKWPPRIKKNETFTLGGFVRVENADGRGVPGVVVDLFLNETKELPGEPLGQATTGSDGRFTLTTTIPFELAATKYHLVAHALEKREGCMLYREHWSDPEMEVTSRTRVELLEVHGAVAGRPVVLRGLLRDTVDAPVRNAAVTLTVDGRTHEVRTDANGIFALEFTPPRAGEVKWSASFAGTEYYGGSRSEGTFRVQNEHLRLDMGFDLVRSQPAPLSGKLVLPPGEKPQPITFRFEGVKVATCAGCPARDTLTVTPAADGTFAADLVVPSDQDPGAFRVSATGKNLEKPLSYEGRVIVPVTLALDVHDNGPIEKAYGGQVVLLDEVGRPYPGTVRIESVDGALVAAVDAQGRHAFELSATECGEREVRASFDGDANARPAIAQKLVTPCPLLASLPAWLLAVPWWLWVLLLLALAVAAYMVRRWLLSGAAVISHGPPLTLAHTEPRDLAAGIVGVGESATLTVFLEEPLPEGYTVRMGPGRRTAPVPVGPDLRADLRIEADALGEMPVRAEILDARGRVVTRRTSVLRVVRYAEEIETRYRRLRGAEGAGEAVTPREFEAWLRERRPSLDPAVAARLVALFEEADYGPRSAARAELVAYLEAEQALPEVTPAAPLA